MDMNMYHLHFDTYGTITRRIPGSRRITRPLFSRSKSPKLLRAFSQLGRICTRNSLKWTELTRTTPLFSTFSSAN